MLLFPNCKINLGLYVTQKREDGFHNIETIFLPINITDALELLPSNHLEKTPLVAFNSTGLPIAGNSSSNLCIKAYHLLQQPYDLPAIQMHLHKNIPMGAGLGGGSSNGAFTLQMLNQQFGLNITAEKLMEYALQLGSDCPFFIYNQPCLATSRGENLTPLTINLSDYSVVIVNPNIHINTGWAFSKITPTTAPSNWSNAIQQPIDCWKNYIHNQFEMPVFTAYPEIAAIKDTLYQQGALYASLTGTGSTVFGIFQKNNLPQNILSYFHNNYYKAITHIL